MGVVDLIVRLFVAVLQLHRTAQGLFAGGGTPQELGAFLRADITKWARVIRDAGIEPE